MRPEDVLTLPEARAVGDRVAKHGLQSLTMLGFKGSPAHPERCVAQANGLIFEVLELLAALISICSPALEGFASASASSRACLQCLLSAMIAYDGSTRRTAFDTLCQACPR